MKTHRLHGLWATVLVLGLRGSEVCGLHWDDVDLDRGTLRVQRGLQRTGGRIQERPTVASIRVVCDRPGDGRGVV